MNEKFVIILNYSPLPINVGVLSFAISYDKKHLMVTDTIFFLTTGQCNAEEGNRLKNSYIILCKYTT